MTRVLMATDGSVHANTAMLTTSHLLGRRDADIDIICVGREWAAAPQGADDRVHRELEKQHTLQALRTLNASQHILAQLHRTSNGKVTFGSPAEELLKLSGDYDLLAVGAYGNHDRKQPGLGPVTSRLVQQCIGNLIVGRELVNERVFRVLVALDNSEVSLTALRSLPSLFDPAVLEVTLIHVFEPFWNTQATEKNDEFDSREVEEYKRRMSRESRQAANAIMDVAMQELDRWSIPASRVIREGDPSLELVHEAEQGGYDLVVAGATGASKTKHALLGSVSLKLAWDSPSSVLLIRKQVVPETSLDTQTREGSAA